MSNIDTQFRHSQLVSALFKDGKDIMKDISPWHIEMMHASAGMCGEAGEILDLVKKNVFNGHQVDRDKLIKELGDLEFYLEAFRQTLGVTRDECLEGNIAKLRKRYPDGYSDKASIERKDTRPDGSTT